MISELARDTVAAMMHFQPDRHSRLIDYRQLRQLVSIEQVLQLIGWQLTATHGPQLRGPCPVHRSTNSRSRSFSVNLEKNAYRCFSCGSQGNQLDLAAAVFGEELYQAAHGLCRQLGIEPPRMSRG